MLKSSFHLSQYCAEMSKAAEANEEANEKASVVVRGNTGVSVRIAVYSVSECQFKRDALTPPVDKSNCTSSAENITMSTPHGEINDQLNGNVFT